MLLHRLGRLVAARAAPPGNIPPIVAITSPASGYTTPAPGQVFLVASASDPDGPDPTVQFYRSGVPVGSPITSAPYTYTDTNVTAAIYQYTARATDVSGAFTTSVPVTVTIGQPQQTPTPSPDGTKSVTITENDLTVWTLGTDVGAPNLQTLRNGVWVGAGGGFLYEYFGGNVYVKSSGGGGTWFRWTGSSWVSVGTTDPSSGVVTPVQRIFAGSGNTITDGIGDVYSFGPQGPSGSWEFTNYPVMRNGTQQINTGDQVLYYQGVIWVHNTLGAWYRAGVKWGVNDPTGTEIFAQTVITPPAQVPSGGVRASYTEAQLASGAGPAGLVYFAMEQAKLPTYPLTNYYTSHTSEYRIFPQYPGVTFARQFSDGTNPDGSTFPSLTMCSWSYFFPAGVDEVWVSWVIMLDPDLKNGLLENGVKLHGADTFGENLATIAFARKSDRLTLPARYPLATYSYFFNVFQLLEDIPNEYLYEGVFHSIDIRAKLNTVGVNNGEREIWVDDRQVHLKTDIQYRNSSASHLNRTELLLYQGGQNEFPARNTHIWIGPYTVTTPAIGRTGMLRKTSAAWMSVATLNTMTPIPNTKFVDAIGNTTGKSCGEAIDSWIGLQSTKDHLYSSYGGGHNATQWLPGVVFDFDHSRGTPYWEIISPIPDRADLANNSTIARDFGLHSDYRGVSTGNHNYYQGEVIESLNVIFIPCKQVYWAADTSGSTVPSIFNLATRDTIRTGHWTSTQADYQVGNTTWIDDPSAGWPNAPFFPTHGTYAVDPVSGDHFMAGYRVATGQHGLYRFRIATRTWDFLSNAKVRNNVASFIDGPRGLWCFVCSGELDMADRTISRFRLSDNTFIDPLVMTGAGFTSGTIEPSLGPGNGGCMDSDNDSYISVSNSARVYATHPTTGATAILSGVDQTVANGILGRVKYSAAKDGGRGGIFLVRSATVDVDFILRVA